MSTLILILGIYFLLKALKKGGGFIPALLAFLCFRHYRKKKG